MIKMVYFDVLQTLFSESIFWKCDAFEKEKAMRFCSNVCFTQSFSFLLGSLCLNMLSYVQTACKGIRIVSTILGHQMSSFCHVGIGWQSKLNTSFDFTMQAMFAIVESNQKSLVVKIPVYRLCWSCHNMCRLQFVAQSENMRHISKICFAPSARATART